MRKAELGLRFIERDVLDGWPFDGEVGKGGGGGVVAPGAHRVEVGEKVRWEAGCEECA